MPSPLLRPKFLDRITADAGMEFKLSEEKIDIPMDRINPDTLQKMIEEFVTREWSEPGNSEFTLDEKVSQVLRQLENKQARIVYDVTSETWNIIPCR